MIRVRYRLAQLIAWALCEPQVKLGRRRHDGHCDSCGDDIGSYAMEKLDFLLDDLDPDASTKREKIQAMLGADYVRYCLECGDEKEDGDLDE